MRSESNYGSALFLFFWKDRVFFRLAKYMKFRGYLVICLTVSYPDSATIVLTMVVYYAWLDYAQVNRSFDKDWMFKFCFFVSKAIVRLSTSSNIFRGILIIFFLNTWDDFCQTFKIYERNSQNL
jgi:hypothetical protein